jgi:hypothetical protein
MKDRWECFKEDQIQGPFVVELMKMHFSQEAKIILLSAEVRAVLSKCYNTRKRKTGAREIT